jgi:pimeloyl-ACP methyl ester carboxylesterase
MPDSGLIFQVQPQPDGFFCLWPPAAGSDVLVEFRSPGAEAWQSQQARHPGCAFIPAISSEACALRLSVGAARAERRRSAEVGCAPIRERFRDRFPARVPYTTMRRFHHWRRFAAFAAARAGGRVGTRAGAEIEAGSETPNGIYLVAGEPVLLSRAIGRGLQQHPTHAPDLTRTYARSVLCRDEPGALETAPLEQLGAALPAGVLAYSPELFIAGAGDLRSRILRLRAPRAHGGTAIYHEGHTGAGTGLGWSTVEFLLNRGWDVCCVDMLLCGVNAVDRRPGREIHNDLMHGTDPLAPLVSMVAPLRALADRLCAERRGPLVIAGRSGGGLMAYLFAAIEPRVEACVSLAGGVPLSQRLELATRDLGDYEQYVPEFFDLVRHEDLMIAAAGRRLLLVYNSNDTDCFALPPGHPLSDYLRREAARFGCSLQVVIDPRHRGHSFGPLAYDEAARFLAPLERAA